MIDNLVIGYIPNDSEQPEYDLGTLLPYWAPALTTLTVAVNFVTDFHEQLHKAQWDAIKVMSNLRRLHLLGFSAYEVPLDILSLKQLTEFSLIRNPTFLKLDRILPQLGVNLKILRLFHEQIQQLDLEPSIGKWATGLDTLTLTISYPFELVSFISSFTGIRHFDFSPMSSFSFPFNDLLSHLSTYAQLNTLSFDFDAIRHYTLVGEDQDGQIHEHMLSTNEWYRRYHVRLPQLAPLRTISTLNLTDREYNFFQADVLGVEIGDVEEECIYKSNVDASHLLLLATAFPATKTVNLFSHFAGEEKFKEEVGGQVKHFWGEGVQVTFSKWATWGETRRHFGLTAKPENGS